MTPRIRRLALTAHVSSSVGWLGAVVVFLALAIAGWTSDDAAAVRSAYIAMEMTGWLVLLPLALASLITGVIQGLGTHWGLVRHYWVLIKLLITLVATLVLLMYLATLGSLADLAARAELAGPDLGRLQTPSPVLHAGAAVLLLLVATTLAVFKPRGETRYGRRRSGAQSSPRPDARA